MRYIMKLLQYLTIQKFSLFFRFKVLYSTHMCQDYTIFLFRGTLCSLEGRVGFKTGYQIGLTQIQI